MSLPSKLEILFVSHKYPPATGGMEKQSYELIHGMHEKAIVHTILYVKDESIVTFFSKLNKRILAMVKTYPAIQLIHFNDGLIASLSLFHHGYDHLKKVVTVHGLDVVFPLGYFQNKVLPRFNAFDKIIAVSEATAQAIITRGVQQDKVTVINNGVDHLMAMNKPIPLPELYKIYPQLQPNKKYFITLGRAVKRKGSSWLLAQVVPRIKEDYQLVMVGPFTQKTTNLEKILPFLPRKAYSLLTLFLGYPTDQSKIRMLLQKPEINKKAVHLGKIPIEHLQTLLANASAFLMPNITVKGDMEGFGLVCLEASLSGTLVLASGIEGIKDAIHHQRNGILLPSEQAEVWTEQLEDVLKNSAMYSSLTQTFQKYSKEHYSWEKMCQEYYEVFKRCTVDLHVS